MSLQSSPDGRAVRAGKNQSLFRSVNERVEELVGGGDGLVQFVCECADEECHEQVYLSVAEYESVRRDATHFVVKHGHVVHDVERVVFAGERYSVVAKEGEAAQIALGADERP
jgi:hypothetical protein